MQVVGAAVRGGTGLMLVMVLQRGMNFVLNQLLLRHVDPAVFGIASIPLDLLLNTALFLSRWVLACWERGPELDWSSDPTNEPLSLSL